MYVYVVYILLCIKKCLCLLMYCRKCHFCNKNSQRGCFSLYMLYVARIFSLGCVNVHQLARIFKNI